jgi:hypothetical protein
MPMDEAALRAMIRGKIRDGRLPNDRAPKFWGGHSNGERACDACGSVVTTGQWLTEVATVAGGSPLQLHFRCFAVWEQERREPKS